MCCFFVVSYFIILFLSQMGSSHQCTAHPGVVPGAPGGQSPLDYARYPVLNEWALESNRSGFDSQQFHFLVLNHEQVLSLSRLLFPLLVGIIIIPYSWHHCES